MIHRRLLRHPHPGSPSISPSHPRALRHNSWHLHPTFLPLHPHHKDKGKKGLALPLLLGAPQTAGVAPREVLLISRQRQTTGQALRSSRRSSPEVSSKGSSSRRGKVREHEGRTSDSSGANNSNSLSKGRARASCKLNPQVISQLQLKELRMRVVQRATGEEAKGPSKGAASLRH